ncbi:SusC/RagA family TonB-linked outer membrane protein [Fulvitalea axinellae]|uniref:SusC/RagA family TonB-linked outer membrane protein n=1 Tax=Fulvitalea axinellae TaxID=1182444 RepID=UPI0030CA3649
MFLFLMITIVSSSAVAEKRIKVSLNFSSQPLEEVVREIGRQANKKVLYNNWHLSRYSTVTIEGTFYFDEALKKVFEASDLEYKVIKNHIVVKKKKAKKAPLEVKTVEVQQQTQKVTGNVTDKEDGGGLPGVSVAVKGTTRGMVTDVNGKFSLEVEPEDILVFSFVGYKNQEIKVGNQTNINVSLEPDLEQLEEVVVIGYGTQKKKHITGAVATLKGKQLVKAPATNMATALTGKLPGVITRQTSGVPGAEGIRLRIRGVTSYKNHDKGEQNPLVIVDGIERPFSRLDPNEIADISVLKDAAATAIYGRRGANGVLLITTKRGQEGKPSFEYSGRFSIQKRTREVEAMSAPEFVRYYNEAKINDGEDPAFSDEVVEAYQRGELPGYNWLDALLDETAPQQQHNFSASGGSKKVKYFVSYGYLDQEGLYSTVGYNQNNLRTNIDTKFSDRLSFSLDLAGRIEERSNTSYDRGIYETAIYAQPILNPLPNVPGVPDALGYNGFSGSPIGQAERSGTKDRNKTYFQSNISFKYDIPGVKGLSAKALFSYDILNERETNFNKPYTWYEYNETTDKFTETKAFENNDILSKEYRKQWVEKTLQLNLSYNRTFGDHNVSGLVLLERLENDFNEISGERKGYISTSIPYFFAGDEGNDKNNSKATESASLGWVGRLSYNYKDKYMIQFNSRIDKSFKFDEEYRTGFFPSVSAGWRISSEPFMKALPFVSNLKVRGSWGQVGNDNVPSFKYLATYSFRDGTVMDGIWKPGIKNDGIPNPTITWETVTSQNIGIDAGFFENKYEFELDYYWRTTTDILDKPDAVVPATYGGDIAEQPLGEFDSWGIDALVRHRNQIGKLKYSVSANVSWYDNKVVKKAESENVNPALSAIGRRVGQRKGYISEGLFQTQEEIDNHAKQPWGEVFPGDIKYKDINGRDEEGNLTGKPDGKINGDDKTIIGTSGFTNFVYGFSLSAEYEGFDFQANFQGATNYTSHIRMGTFTRDGNALKVRGDSWRPGNEDARYPRMVIGSASNNTQDSDFWMQEIWYLRLRNIELGYNFDKFAFVKKAGLKKVRVFASGTNLWTLTNVDWLDPESAGSGIQYYPQMINMSAGIQVGF